MPMIMLFNYLDGFLWINVVSIYLPFFMLLVYTFVTFEIKNCMCA